MDYNKVEAISTKGLTKDLINAYKILNRARYFYSGTLQNHLIYFSYKDDFTFFTNIRKFLSWESIGLSQERVENITKPASNFASNLINYYPILINYYPMKIKVDSDDNLPFK